MYYRLYIIFEFVKYIYILFELISNTINLFKDYF